MRALADDLQLPEYKRRPLPQIKADYQDPFRIRADLPTLRTVHNNLIDSAMLDELSRRYGNAGVQKLRAFLQVTPQGFSPTKIEIDLAAAKLYYQPVGAREGELTESKEWAGEPLEDAANLLHFACNYLRFTAVTRERFLVGTASWEQTLGLCRSLEGIAFKAPEAIWSLRGALLSPKSYPDTALWPLRNEEPDLFGFGTEIKQAWNDSKTVTGRLMKIDDSGIFTIRQGEDPTKQAVNSQWQYRGFDVLVDAHRQPVDAKILATVLAHSTEGVAVDVRYVLDEEDRVAVFCQIKDIDASLVAKMAEWDGQTATLRKIAKQLEITSLPVGKHEVREVGKINEYKGEDAVGGQKKAGMWIKKSLGIGRRW